MTKPESSLERWYVKEAVLYGFLSLKLVALSRTGFPDRTHLGKKAHIFFVELKRHGEKPKPHQKKWHKLLRKLGFRVYVVSTKEKAIRIFEREKKLARS